LAFLRRHGAPPGGRDRVLGVRSGLSDEFGRVTQSSKSDTGTTTYQYDELNRLKQLVPPSPRKQLDFAYSIDATYQRWINTVTVAGLGNYVSREDTKGRLSEVVSPLLTSGANTWICQGAFRTEPFLIVEN
jgi:hypothetical protein